MLSCSFSKRLTVQHFCVLNAAHGFFETLFRPEVYIRKWDVHVICFTLLNMRVYIAYLYEAICIEHM